MIPKFEIAIEKIKRMPVLNHLRKIQALKSISRRLRENYIDKRIESVQVYGYEMLDKIFNISQELGIPIWIDWGTLLGFFREGKLIEHDYDLDIATWRLNIEEHKRFLDIMSKNGFNLVRRFSINDEILTDAFEYKGVLIDVEYYLREGNNAVTFSFDLSNESITTLKNGEQFIDGMNLYQYRFSENGLVISCFSNGTKCYVPSDTEQRVLAEYGPSWKTPIKNASWKDLHNYDDLGFNKDLKGWRKK